MIAADTSVVVAAFASWHERHRSAQRLLEREEVRLIDQRALEAQPFQVRLLGRYPAVVGALALPPRCRAGPG